MRYGDNAAVARRITNDEIATVAKNGRSRAAKTAARAARGAKSMPGTLKLDGNWPAKTRANWDELQGHAQKVVERHTSFQEPRAEMLARIRNEPAPAVPTVKPREPWKKTTTAALVGTGTVAVGAGAVNHHNRRVEASKRLGVMPTLARRRPNLSMRRVVTGKGVIGDYKAVASGLYGRAGRGQRGKAWKTVARASAPYTSASIPAGLVGAKVGQKVAQRAGLSPKHTLAATKLSQLAAQAPLGIKGTREGARALRSQGIGKGMHVIPASHVAAPVEKFSPTGMFESLSRGAKTVADGTKAVVGGAKAGYAGLKPTAALPNSQLRDAKTLGLANQGAKAGGWAASNPGKTAALIGTGGVATGALANNQLSKRSFDPEDRRRHYQGVAAGVGGSAGAASLFNAGRIARQDTRDVNNARIKGSVNINALKPSLKTPLPKRGEKADASGRPHPLHAERLAHAEQDYRRATAAHSDLARRLKGADKLRGRKLISIGGRSAGYGAAGLALIGTAAASHRGRNDERWD